jgi:hypothetical protein
MAKIRGSLLAALALVTASVGLAGEPPPRIVDPFRLLERKNLKAHRASSNSADPRSNDDSARPIPGETTVLADLAGPGIVDHVWLTVADSEYGWPRLLRLRVYYDGSAVASVDVPLGDFFAVGHGLERPVRSFMVRASSEGRSRNSYWPMPFRRSCRITVTNEGRRRVSNLYYHVDWARVPSLPETTPYFHARYRQALPAPPDGSPYEVLKVRGRGHYVGTVLSVVQAEAGWFGEGDDLFYVDGEERPSIEGTGTEDYFNDAWGLHVDEGPYTGVPVAEGTGLGSRMTAYRWHLVDPVPFTRSLRFVVEHKGWTFDQKGVVQSAFGERTDLLSSVAFWYQQGIATDQPALPYGPARLPQGNATQVEVEARLAEVRAEGGKAFVVPDLFWSKDVIRFEAEGPGSRLEVPFDVPEDGEYEVYTQLAQGPDYGVYTVLLDGKPPGAPRLEHEPGADARPQTQLDGYAVETYVGADFQVGWPRLAKGRHTLTYACLGRNSASAGYSLGVDDIVLARTGAAAWSAAALVHEPRRPSGTAVDLAHALADPDPVVRGLAALELRSRGGEAQPALDALRTALRDADANVRLMSANAIGAIGKEATPAVPDLVAACSVPDEQVHVLRSCASALGAIGPPAAVPALPVLREIAKQPRVRWAAEAAIRRIEGGP